MNDVLKQERQKLHMAADNMRQMIQVLIDRDEKHFLWAWQQLESNLQAVRACFIGAAQEHREKIEKLFDDHKDLLDLKEKLTAKLFKKINPDNLSDDDIEKYTNKFIEFIQDMSIQFKLADFEE
jgi:predicted RNA-binding protein with EMAP domain